MNTTHRPSHAYLRHLSAAALLGLTAASGCLVEGEATGDEATAAEVAHALEDGTPLALGQMSADDLPRTASVRISFVGEDNAYEQLQRLPPQRRACATEALTNLGMGPLLEPEVEPGTVATMNGTPSLLQAECAGQIITVSVATAAAGTNDEGNITACVHVVIDFFHDLADFLCREVVCLSMSGGRHWTCGCKNSDIADCANCPAPPLDDYWQVWQSP